MKFNLYKQRGFTWIEIVMMIIILGIVASIAIPRFFNLSGKSQPINLSE